MKISELTPEIESSNEDFTEGTVLFTHPFIDDCYARVNVKFDGWNWNQQWTYAFDDTWSGYDDFKKTELEKAAKDFWQEKVSEYEEEKRERDEYVSDAYEQYLNR